MTRSTAVGSRESTSFRSSTAAVRLAAAYILTGKADQLAEDIARLAELGVRDLVLNLQRDTLERSLDSMHYVVDEVRPLVK